MCVSGRGARQHIAETQLGELANQEEREHAALRFELLIWPTSLRIMRTNLNDARRKIELWREDYNQQRPHSSLNYL